MRLRPYLRPGPLGVGAVRIEFECRVVQHERERRRANVSTNSAYPQRPGAKVVLLENEPSAAGCVTFSGARDRDTNVIKLGYKLMSEEHGPADLVRNARRAEDAG